MNPDEAIFNLDVVAKLHADGYITDEQFGRYKRHVGENILAEYERYKKPWWKIW